MARLALARDPASADAVRVMVAVADRVGTPEGMIWREKLTQLEPDNLAARLRFAAEALRYDELGAAEELIETTPPEKRDSAQWHSLAAAVAIKRGRNDVAAEHFAKALAMEPQNADLARNAAGMRMTSRDPEIAKAGRAELDALSQDPAQAAIVLRMLVADARTRKDTEAALKLSERLAAARGSTARDRLQRVEILEDESPEAARAALAELQQEEGDRLQGVYEIVTWMVSHRRAEEARAWLQTLPPIVVEAFPVTMAAAEMRVALRDWEGLRAALQEGAWGQLDFLRAAYLARAELELADGAREPAFQKWWDLALSQAKGQRSTLSMLGRQAEAWGWAEESARVWWVIANARVGQAEALRALYRIQKNAGNTQGLFEVTRRIREVEPDNPAALNNYAMLALLADRDVEEAHLLARKVWEAHPKVTAFLSTYAFSLVKQRRAGEAVDLFQTLSPEQLEEPMVALYYGVALSENRETERAKPFLERAARGGGLLPEELAFVRLSTLR